MSLDPASSPSAAPDGRTPWGLVAGAAVGGALVTALVVYLLVPAGPPAGAAGGAPAGAGAAPPGFGPPPVEVVAAVETVAAEPVQLLGSVAPLRESVVASEVEGVVAEVAVEEGDDVRTGGLLARLRTTTMELDLRAAQANRDEASARLVRFEAELARLTELRSKRAISEQEYDQALAERDAQRQTVARHEAEAARLQELIARARIEAPFDGRVTAVHAELGEWVGRGGDVATLVDLAQVEVTVPIPERYVSQAREVQRQGTALQVTFDALTGEFTGRIRAVIPEANAQARTFPVLVTVDNPDGRIQSGMFARVWAQVGEPVPTVLVPKDALVLRSGRTFVYRVRSAPPPAGAPGGAAPGGEEGEAAMTGEQGVAGEGAPTGAPDAGGQPPMTVVEELAVEIGPGLGAWQVIRGTDLSGGDLVVVRGNENLQPGMPVNVAATLEMQAPPELDPGLPVGARGTEDRP